MLASPSFYLSAFPFPSFCLTLITLLLLFFLRYFIFPLLLTSYSIMSSYSFLSIAVFLFYISVLPSMTMLGLHAYVVMGYPFSLLLFTFLCLNPCSCSFYLSHAQFHFLPQKIFEDPEWLTTYGS